MVQVNTNGATTSDYKTLDLIIDLETKRKISRVMGAEDYGISTACFIDGEFILVSNYPVCKEIQLKLEKA